MSNNTEKHVEKHDPKHEDLDQEVQQILEGHSLTIRQRAFIIEYTIDFNHIEATRRAGYSEAGIAVTASRLLSNTKIALLIRKVKRARFKALNIGPQDILDFHAEVMQSSKTTTKEKQDSAKELSRIYGQHNDSLKVGAEGDLADMLLKARKRAGKK